MTVDVTVVHPETVEASMCWMNLDDLVRFRLSNLNQLIL